MIILEFIEKLKPLGLCSRADLEVIYPGLDSRRLYEWQVKGYILKLRNSWYCLPGLLKEPYSTWIIANAVHAPSYISLESALSFHGLFPMLTGRIKPVRSRSSCSIQLRLRK